MKDYLYHALSWPSLLYVAESDYGKIVGYVMAKTENDEEAKFGAIRGYITSISVLRSHRKLGIETKLMKASEYAMMTIYGAEYCSLHVRITNREAISLYKDDLGFKVINIDEKYYADGEDALEMRVYFKNMNIIKGGKAGAEEEEKKAVLEDNVLATGDKVKTSGGKVLTESNLDADKKKKKKNKKKKKGGVKSDAADNAQNFLFNMEF
jgi:peptide alpha-N-acetyltransferase